MGETLSPSPEEIGFKTEPTQPEQETPTETGIEKPKLEEDEELKRREEEERRKQEEEKKIAAEKEKIIAEMIQDLKNIFAELNPQDLQSVLANGRRSNGENLEAGSLGELRPEQAQNLAVRYQEGRLTSDVMDNFSDILQRLDEWLTAEAKRRIKEAENQELQNEEVPETEEPVKEEGQESEETSTSPAQETSVESEPTGGKEIS